MRRKNGAGWIRVAVAALPLLAATSTARAEVSREQFLLRSGADLVALCSAGPEDPLHTPAVHMCEGFAVGVYRTIQALTNLKGTTPLFCPWNPPPTRDAEIARFLVWAQGHVAQQSERPEDYLGRYLIEAFPCPQGGAKGAKARSR